MPRRPIRLPPEAYREGHCFSVTIDTYYRKRIFEQATAANVGLRCLRDAARRYSARVYAYCFMPDHVHLVAQIPPGTDFARFVNYLKQSSGLALREVLGTRESIWQPRFYDHALRSDEGLVAACEYVLNNPVRAGLVAAARDYPYSGSIEWPDVFEQMNTTEPKGTELHSDAVCPRPRFTEDT